jgi:hypothetical protein
MNRLLGFIMCCVTLAVLPACSKNGIDGDLLEPQGKIAREAALSAQAMSSAETDGTADKLPLERRKLIKEGHISFETASLPDTRESILRAVTKYEGYVASDQQRRLRDRVQQELEIRVPAEHFEELLSEIGTHVDRLERKHIQVKDVTEEYVDVQSRLRTKKALKSRYEELLEKAVTVKDMLAIEKEMGKLQEDIESVEGRLKYLDDRITLGTLRVTMFEKTTTAAGLSWNRFKTAFITGWNNFLAILMGLLKIWPVLLIAVGVWYGIRRIRRARRKKKAESTPAAGTNT